MDGQTEQGPSDESIRQATRLRIAEVYAQSFPTLDPNKLVDALDAVTSWVIDGNKPA